jgi:hypothetical protein
MPRENEANFVDPSEEDDEIVDPSEGDVLAEGSAGQQLADEDLGDPPGEGDGPNRWGDGPNR